MISRVINSGITYLQSQQQADGSFISFTSSDANDFTQAHKYHCVFPTALILSCLNTLEQTPEIAAIKHKAALFLLTQKSENWSYNYWIRHSQESKEMPYPDDLDDTFCALAALYQYDPNLIDGSVLVHIISLLTSTETQEGGPYRTWLVPETAPTVWKDIDIVVNSNIGYFLSLLEIDLPNLTTLIDTAFEKKQFTSAYYPTLPAMMYFISRFYKGKKIDHVISLLQGKKVNENPLHAALRISTLLNFNVDPKTVEKEIIYMIQSQKNGFWQPYGLYKDPAVKKVAYFAGSSTLTTAFCLEALGKYVRIIASEKQNSIKQKDNRAEKIHTAIMKQALQRFSSISPELKEQATDIITKMFQADSKKQITLLPYYFAAVLEKKSFTLPENFLINLGLTNTYGWIAYTVYDDFLDQEGNPKQLSIGTIALREVTVLYRAIGVHIPKFWKLFQKIMDDLDGANTWEVTHCRIPIINETIQLKASMLPHFGNYNKLAQKSLGHALGPLAILFLLGFTEKSPEVKNLLRFFTHYLIARQLNDDAHDWEKDLAKGHITPVVSMVLKKWKEKNKIKENDIILTLVNSKLPEIFWYYTIIDVSNIVLNHVQLARKYLHTLSIIKDPTFLENLLNPLEHAAKKALDEQKKTIEFLTDYDL